MLPSKKSQTQLPRISAVEGVFYTTSPLQLLCATEARERFRLKETLLISLHELNRPQRNARQIEGLIQQFHWDKVIRINYEKKSKFFDYLRLLHYLKHVDYQHLFVGELSSFARVLIANSRIQKAYLLDDGMAVLSQRREVANLDFAEWKSKLRKFFRDSRFLLFGFRLGYKEKLGYFSFILKTPLYNETLIRHSFEQLKKCLQHKSPNSSERLGGCYFVGTGLENPRDPRSLERGHEVYRTAEQFLGNDEFFVYLPHRTESIEFMKQYLQSYRFRLQQWDFPLEFEFLRRVGEPKLVVSTLSTCLISLKVLFPNAQVVAITWPDAERSSKGLGEVWEQFRAFGIQVCPIFQ